MKTGNILCQLVGSKTAAILKRQVVRVASPRPDTYPISCIQDLQCERQSSAGHHRRREVNHLVVDHGELQQVFGQRVLLCGYLRHKPKLLNYTLSASAGF